MMKEMNVLELENVNGGGDLAKWAIEAAAGCAAAVYGGTVAIAAAPVVAAVELSKIYPIHIDASKAHRW